MAAQTVNLLLNTPFIMAGTVGGSGITYTYTVPSAGLYRVSLQTNVTPPSGLSITVVQNSTTVLTAPTFSPTQSSLQFQIDINCSTSDVITVNLTSSTAVDELLNTVKTTCQISNGL